MSVHGKLNPAFCLTSRTVHKYPFILLGPVVWRWNFSLGFYIPLFKTLFGVIFCNNHIPDKKNSTEFSFKSFRSEIRFHTNPGLSWHSFVQCYTGWSKALWVRVKYVALISPYLKMINKVHFCIGHQFGKMDQLLSLPLLWMMFCMSQTLVIAGYCWIVTYIYLWFIFK